MGWPKPSMRSPSRQVTVPIPVKSTSPRASCTPNAAPGTIASGPRSATFAADEPPCTGSRP